MADLFLQKLYLEGKIKLICQTRSCIQFRFSNLVFDLVDMATSKLWDIRMELLVWKLGSWLGSDLESFVCGSGGSETQHAPGPSIAVSELLSFAKTQVCLVSSRADIAFQLSHFCSQKARAVTTKGRIRVSRRSTSGPTCRKKPSTEVWLFKFYFFAVFYATLSSLHYLDPNIGRDRSTSHRTS